MTINALPKLTDEQRRENLKKAKKARETRAKLLNRVRSGELSFAAAIEEPDASRIPVRTLVLSVPGCGRAKTEALLASVDVKESRRVRGLGKHQKAMLVEALS